MGEELPILKGILKGNVTYHNAPVRFGRVPKREKARILAAMQQSTQNRGQQRALESELDDQPRLLAAVLRAHMETCEFTKDKVTAMRQRARDCPSFSMPTLLACPLNPAPELQSEQEFSQRFAHVIRGVIDFAGMIPGFQLLTQDDKFTLLKAGLFDALFVRLICMFDSSINSIICLNGQVMRREAIQNGANARFLVDSTFNFAERMNSMNLTDTEIGLFCAIVLITPDRPGLRNIELIEKMYSRLKACLQTVVTQNRPDQPEFLSELMKTLPDLRTLSTLHTEKLVVFRTEHKELLRQQMWSMDEDQQSKSPGSSTWDTNIMEDVAKSPLGSVSSTESGDLDIASSAPHLAATLSCPLRHRANSGSSAEDVDIVGSHAHLTQNGLTITPVARSHSHPHLNSRYRKLDSPTDSGIESGNEKAESTKTASSGGSSSCSSPRSTVDDVLEEHSSATHAQNVNSLATKRQIVEDMPVLKRVLQAPPLYDTNSLMDEAYKPHKKFRALRHRDFETAEADAHVQQPPVMANNAQQQSQLHMYLTRNNTSCNGNSSSSNSINHHQNQHSSLSSTHSVLAKSLMEEPRMTPEQMKRTDIIQNYIMREQPGNGLLVCATSPAQHCSYPTSSPTSSTSSPSSNLNCSSPSTTTVTLSSPPPPPHAMRWQGHSVITTTSLRQQSASPSGVVIGTPNGGSSSNYFQSPHSTSISSPRASPSAQSPRLLELQVDIADSQQPLNLSKKSPTPPPQIQAKTIQRSYPLAADITVTATTTAPGATAQVHKVLLEA